MKLSTYWWVIVTTVLWLLDSDSVVLGAKIKNTCDAFRRKRISEKKCTKNQECEVKNNKCVTVAVSTPLIKNKCEAILGENIKEKKCIKNKKCEVQKNKCVTLTTSSPTGAPTFAPTFAPSDAPSISPSSLPTKFRGNCKNLEGYKFYKNGRGKSCQKFVGDTTKDNKKNCNKKDENKNQRRVKVFCPQQCGKDCVTSSPSTSPSAPKTTVCDSISYQEVNKLKKSSIEIIYRAQYYVSA